MKRRVRKLIAFVAASFMLFSVFFTSVSASAQETALQYAALGDSVTVGMSAYINYDPPIYYGYADRLNTAIGLYMPTDYVNKGIAGLDSTEMLAMLKSDGQYRASASGKDLVTINIGGNNLLTPFIGAVFGIFGVLVSGEVDENEIYLLKNLIQAMSEEDAMSTYALLSYPDGQLATELRNRTKAFKSDFPRIIASIKKMSPDAVIIVNNLYNPLVSEDPLYALVEKYVVQINKTIDGLSEEGGFAVADVYSEFKNYPDLNDLVAFNTARAIAASHSLSTSYFAMFLDPHPTHTGHQLIFSLESELLFTPF